MTIVLRLQGLDMKAGTKDIRTFFGCLHIPEAGVYIVGGSLGEAFIAFNTERDAQAAMRLTGNLLKGSKVTIHISSMKELEHKLKKSLLKRKKPTPVERAAKRPKKSQVTSPLPLIAKPHKQNVAKKTQVTAVDHITANLPQTPKTGTVNLQVSNANVMDSNTAFLLGMCTVLQGLQSSRQRETNEAVPRVGTLKADSTVPALVDPRSPRETLEPGYVRLFGLPASVTKEDICHFFRGLNVQEVIVNVKLGLFYGCLVKFANAQDACEALHFNGQSLVGFVVEVRGATEKMWTSALQECEMGVDNGERVKSMQSPLKETANHTRKPAPARPIKKPSVNCPPFKSQKNPRQDGDSTTTSLPEYIVMARNLPKTMTKTEIKELFGCPKIEHKCVQHLLDNEGNRTDTAFLIFHRSEDYDYAMNLNGCHLGSQAIKVSSITKKMMKESLAKSYHIKKNWKKESDPAEPPEEAPGLDQDPAALTCLFVRNMPANVNKGQIKGLFKKYKLQKEDISLLLDSDSRGIGEGVVQFKSQKLATLAQRLHGREFLGTKVLLTLINVKQKEAILARNA